jgi:hypothetical protein
LAAVVALRGESRDQETPMRDIEAFDYHGHFVTIEIRQPSAESDTGVYLTTITVTAPGPDGRPGAPLVLCRRAQYVYMDEAAAYDAAVARAKAHVDGSIGAP